MIFARDIFLARSQVKIQTYLMTLQSILIKFAEPPQVRARTRIFASTHSAQLLLGVARWTDCDLSGVKGS